MTVLDEKNRYPHQFETYQRNENPLKKGTGEQTIKKTIDGTAFIRADPSIAFLLSKALLNKKAIDGSALIKAVPSIVFFIVYSPVPFFKGFSLR